MLLSIPVLDVFGDDSSLGEDTLLPRAETGEFMYGLRRLESNDAARFRNDNMLFTTVAGISRNNGCNDADMFSCCDCINHCFAPVAPLTVISLIPRTPIRTVNRDEEQINVFSDVECFGNIKLLLPPCLLDDNGKKLMRIYVYRDTKSHSRSTRLNVSSSSLANPRHIPVLKIASFSLL